MVRNIIASAAVAVGLVFSAPGMTSAQDTAPTMNIVETAVNAGSFNTPVAAVKAADVVKLTTAETVNGQSVDIKVMDGKVMIDGAEVVSTDIQTTNGVIHVINKVILPDMKFGRETTSEHF